MTKGSTAAFWAMAGAFGALLSSCVESHVQTDPLPLERFCDAFFEAMCAPLAECECGDAAVALCRLEERELCDGFPSAAMARAVAEGRLLYDGAAAAALVMRMQGRAAECESFADAIDWRVRDLFSIGGVFTGTVAAGEECEVLGFELISECALGSCAPVGGSMLCRTSVSVTERCDETHQCADLDAAITIDLGIDRLALRCVGEDGAATCAPRVADGGECAAGSDCESGLCLELRCATRAEGEPCATSRECATGYCDSTSRLCAPGDRPQGAPCDDRAACASHVCVGGLCLPAGCGTF